MSRYPTAASGPTPALLGREAELAALERFLDRSDFGAFLIEGEPGIGKTTLLGAGVAAARERQVRVLSARATESEAQLPFAALGDLLEPALQDVLPSLPTPQARALEVALLLAEPGDRPADTRTLGVACLGTLRHLSALGSLLVAIDDVQWIDAPSLVLLSFALRRLRDEPVLLLLSWRPGEAQPLPLGLDRALSEDRLTRVRVGPLALVALHRLLRERLAASMDRPTLLRVWELSEGNPFHALELGRALQRRATLRDGGELPVRGSLDALLRARLRALPFESRTALAAVAALADPQLRLVERVGDPDPAFEAQVVELDGQRVRFAHPLLASAAYELLAPGRRRALHRRLAAAVDDPEESARHLALAVDQPDERIAAFLEQAARRARSRGAPQAAADLLQHARRLTPHGRAAWARRGVEAARAYLASGDASTALELATQTAEVLEPGPRRAEALCVAADTESSADRALDLCDRALPDAEGNPELQARILQQRSEVVWTQDRVREAWADAQAALRFAEAADSEETLVAVLAHAGATATISGAEEAADLLGRAQALADRGFSVEPWKAPGHWLGVRHLWRDELERARPLLRSEYERALEFGDDYDRGGLCFHLAQLELRAGAWQEARAYAAECEEAFLASGLQQSRSMPLAALTAVEAHQGNVEAARALASEGLGAIGEVGDSFFATHFQVALGSLELSRGAHCAAVDELEDLPRRLDRIGVEEPAIFPFQADLIEALVGLGRLDAAAASLDALEHQAVTYDRPRLRAWAQRSRGLLLGAQGDPVAALEALEVALAEHASLPVPLELGRTLLSLGVARRRVKSWGAARESLEEALTVFEELGARLWAERARQELSRIGGRTPSGAELTPTERRVAELVADGLSNKEAASALFLSHKTVEANLARVYRKLGVHSRIELARRLTGPTG